MGHFPTLGSTFPRALPEVGVVFNHTKDHGGYERSFIGMQPSMREAMKIARRQSLHFVARPAACWAVFPSKLNCDPCFLKPQRRARKRPFPAASVGGRSSGRLSRMSNMEDERGTEGRVTADRSLPGVIVITGSWRCGRARPW